MLPLVASSEDRGSIDQSPRALTKTLPSAYYFTVGPIVVAVLAVPAVSVGASVGPWVRAREHRVAHAAMCANMDDMPRRTLHPLKDKALTRLAEGPTDDGHVRHRLRKWMVAHGLTLTEFAHIICMGRQQLGGLLNGVCHNQTHMTLAGAFSIEWATQGAVQAWEWLDDPYQTARIRRHRMASALEMESGFKKVVLRGRGGGTPEGMLRNKARTLSRLFQVNWAEVKKRAWADARVTAAWEMADVSHLMIATDGD